MTDTTVRHYTSVGDQMYQLRGQEFSAIPALGPAGLVILVALLAFVGMLVLRRS